MRIGIQSLGSILWGDDVCCSDAPEDPQSLTKFLYVLRGLLRKSLSACIITVPAHLIQVGMLLLLPPRAPTALSKTLKPMVSKQTKKKKAVLDIF